MARKQTNETVAKKSGSRKSATPAPVAPSPEPPEAVTSVPGTLPPADPSERASKKDQILSLYQAGIVEVAELAAITQSRPSYVASVLRDAGELPTYFDLYTSTAEPMNLYSKFFAGKLGFKDEPTARESVAHIDRLYTQFGQAGDRAGQHHALLMALTMFDRARWTGKMAEAAIFRNWMRARLDEVA